MFSPTQSETDSFESVYNSELGGDSQVERLDNIEEFDEFYGEQNEAESNIDRRYDFDDEGDDFSLEDGLTWISDEIENEKIVKKPNNGMRFIAGIAFLTGGIFLATRRISRND
jgi:hypothetical protein